MTSAPASLSINDETAWHADVLPDIDVRLRNCVDGEWLRGEPSPFDTHHSETGRLYETNSGVSPTILGGFHPHKPQEFIPMGYTNLSLMEKRAVIAGGKLVRVWPSRYEPSYGTDRTSFFALSQGSAFSHLSVGLSSSIAHAIGQAIKLSDRMNGDPVIVVRLLKSTAWH